MRELRVSVFGKEMLSVGWGKATAGCKTPTLKMPVMM